MTTSSLPIDFAPLSASPESTVNVAHKERLASLAGGAVLLAYGFKRRSAITPFLAYIGGQLIHRGLTGHCALYQKLGMNTDASAAVKA